MSVKITVIGTGYVGLVSGTCFAELGHDVICVDTDRHKIDMIGEGKLPIYEPQLDELVAKNIEQGRLRFTTDTAASVKGRDAVVIAVGTPSEKETGRPDLNAVHAAVREVAKAIDRFTVIVTKSTVPVGTNRRIHDDLARYFGNEDRCAVASNPEFLREGAAVHDFMEPDRVVVGCDDPRAAAVMHEIYAPLTGHEIPLVETNIETAEMIKYAANAFLAIKVSFINEISDLCEVTGADVRDVAKGLGFDQRIGGAFLRAGPGWGGSCLPKDTRGLMSTARDFGMPLRIVEAAVDANGNRKEKMVARVRKVCGGGLAGKRVCVLGVTFKGQTDDMRESPSLDILPALVGAGCHVVAFDPSSPSEAARLLPDVAMASSPAAAAKDAEILIVLTDWMMFKTYDLEAIAGAMNRPRMLDLRNLFDKDKVLAAGFESYSGLGFGSGPGEEPGIEASGGLGFVAQGVYPFRT